MTIDILRVKYRGVVRKFVQGGGLNFFFFPEGGGTSIRHPGRCGLSLVQWGGGEAS